ncbi:MAG: hypothetical protein WCH61_09160 [bacterium]
MRRLDLIIFLAVMGWMALKFIGAWLEQRSGRDPKDGTDQAPAGGAKDRHRSLLAPPVPMRRRPGVNPLPPAAESASPPELGDLREWFRNALNPEQSGRGSAAGSADRVVAAVRPPVIVPMAAETAEIEREELDHPVAAPLGVLDGGASRPAVAAPAPRRFRPAATALLRATRRRQSLRQGILLAEVLGRPRAFDA